MYAGRNGSKPGTQKQRMMSFIGSKEEERDSTPTHSLFLQPHYEVTQQEEDATYDWALLRSDIVQYDADWKGSHIINDDGYRESQI